MEDCTPTGRENWTGDWEFVGAVPGQVRSGFGPAGQTGVAMLVSYYWRRKFEREFKCCKGAQEITIWVDGNYAFFRHDRNAAGFPVRNIDISLPLPANLDLLSEALGGNINVAIWWVDEGQADGEKPEDPGADTPGNLPSKLAGVPRVECGQFVRMPDGVEIPWVEFVGPVPPVGSTGNTPVPVPPPPRQLPNCCNGLDWAKIRPAVEIVTQQYRRVGSSWFLDLDVRITHECDLKERPTFTFGLVAGSGLTNLLDLTTLSPPLVKSRWAPEPRVFQFSANNQQIPVPPAGPQPWFRLRVTARSKCLGVLDYTLKLSPS